MDMDSLANVLIQKGIEVQGTTLISGESGCLATEKQIFIWIHGGVCDLLVVKNEDIMTFGIFS